MGTSTASAKALVRVHFVDLARIVCAIWVVLFLPFGDGRRLAGPLGASFIVAESVLIDEYIANSKVDSSVT